MAHETFDNVNELEAQAAIEAEIRLSEILVILIPLCRVSHFNQIFYNNSNYPRPKSYLRSCKENNLEYSFKILLRILEFFMLDLGSLRSLVILV